MNVFIRPAQSHPEVDFIAPRLLFLSPGHLMVFTFDDSVPNIVPDVYPNNSLGDLGRQQ